MFRQTIRRYCSITILLLWPPAGLSTQTAVPRSPTPEPVPVSVRVETVVEGLKHPWGLTFLPNSNTVVTERPERIRIARMDGRLSEPLAGLLVRLTMQDGTVVKEDRYLADLHERIRNVVQSPNNHLYLVTDSPEGRILRIIRFIRPPRVTSVIQAGDSIWYFGKIATRCVSSRRGLRGCGPPHRFVDSKRVKWCRATGTGHGNSNENLRRG